MHVFVDSKILLYKASVYIYIYIIMHEFVEKFECTIRFQKIYYTYYFSWRIMFSFPPEEYKTENIKWTVF